MRPVEVAGGWSTQWFCEEQDFEGYLKIAKEPTAAAILYAADALVNLLKDFDHQLSLGSKKVADAIDGLGASIERASE